MAKEYWFLRFGRIDYKSQMSLQSRLPFRVAEFPFVYFKHTGMEPDFVQFKRGQNSLQAIKNALQKKFESHYLAVNYQNFINLVNRTPTAQGSRVYFFGKPGAMVDPGFQFFARYGLAEGEQYVATQRAEWESIKKWLIATKATGF